MSVGGWRFSICAVALVAFGAGASDTAAEEVAPNPIESGEWYLGASGSLERIRAPEFKALRLYVDDSAVTASGKVTVQDPQGYMVHHRIESTEKIPGLYFGYGFGGNDAAGEESVYRIEVAVEAFDRKESMKDDFIPIPDDTYEIDNDAPPPDKLTVGLMSYFIPIDGRENENDDARILIQAPIFDEEFRIEEYSRTGNITLYFDGRRGHWVYSRGVSFTYIYQYQKIDHQYVSVMGLLDPGVTELTSYFEYRSRSHNVGSRLHYSAGYEILPGWSVFTHGRFGMFARYTDFEGKQDAPCLTVCDIPNVIFTRGTRKLRAHDWKFAYDARMGFGSSLRVGPIRVTAFGGGTRIGGWTTPRERSKKVTTATSGGWGYFATASAGLAF